MHETKALLITRCGLTCCGCMEKKELSEIQWHHVKPKYVFKAEHEEIDNSYENGVLLCRRCHATIHRWLWWDETYQLLTECILNNKEMLENDVR